MNRLVGFLPGVIVAAIAALLTAFTRWAGPAIYCGDGWFHVRYASILRESGISRAFPWWQESFLATRFADFNLVYHLLLIPFTLGDELFGARVASVAFAALAMGAFWWCARSLGVPWPALWALALLAAAPEFAYRLTYTRPLVLGLALTFLGTGAIVRGRGVALFVLTFLYAHTHCSFHLLPCLAFLHDAHRSHPTGSSLAARFGTSAWALGGAVAGSVLTPYFPNNLPFWWTANVSVLRASWGAGDLLRVGTEMLPVAANELLATHLGIFVLFGVAIYGLLRAERVSDEARTLLVTAFGFLGLTLLSQRFAELWAPYTVLLAAVAVRDLCAPERFRAPRGALRLALVGAVIVMLAFGLRRTLGENGAAAAAEDPPRWREAARWMKANVPEGETIFHLGWDEFPELFFEDTTHRYLIGQDATFFWATDPERCRLWSRLARGQAEDAWGPVRETFKCRWAFVPRRYRSFLGLARRDPRFTEVWSDGNAIVFRVDDDGATIAGWEVSAGWSDPLRRSFGEPPEALPFSPLGCSTGAFVDLARSARIAGGAADACATATTEVVSLSGGPGTLGITTDDEVTIVVNGAVGYARSPHRKEPVPLASIFGAKTAGNAEAAIPVTLRPGVNTIAVRSCRWGEEFGFILRMR